MTLLEDTLVVGPPLVVAPAEQPPAQAPAPETGVESFVRAVLIVLVVLVTATVLWKAFDQVVAPSWYRGRQQHLAADFAKQRSTVAPGQAVGVLQIPGIGANLVMVEGTGPNALRAGPGHRRGTPLPGGKGNSIVEGHRTRWGGPFDDLGRLVPRTRIVTMTRSGIPVEYRVTAVKVVKRSKVGPWLAPSKDVRITLITHAGGAFSDDRLVVQAVAGAPSKRPGAGAAPAIDPPSGSAGKAALAFLVCLGAAAAAVVRLRRDHGRGAVAVVVVPLLAGALLALLLAIDGSFSALL